MLKSWENLNIAGMLLGLGEDLEREGLLKTPERVESAWTEFLEGYSLEPEKILAQKFQIEGNSGLQICRNIEFTSMCEHHLLPFIGVCHIGYIPRDWVVGLSKLGRLVDCFARRLQIQERMTDQIAKALYECAETKGVYVVVEAKHVCCHGRGIKRSQMDFVTTAKYGDINISQFAFLKGF